MHNTFWSVLNFAVRSVLWLHVVYALTSCNTKPFPPSQSSICSQSSVVWAFSALISCLLPSAASSALVSLIYVPAPSIYPTPPHSVTPSQPSKKSVFIRAGAYGEAGGRVRHFLCDRKLTTNTQRPREWGEGVNENGWDKELQMFDGSKYSSGKGQFIILLVRQWVCCDSW